MIWSITRCNTHFTWMILKHFSVIFLVVYCNRDGHATYGAVSFVIYGFFYASHTESQRGYGVESYSNYDSFENITVNNAYTS